VPPAALSLPVPPVSDVHAQTIRAPPAAKTVHVICRPTMLRQYMAAHSNPISIFQSAPENGIAHEAGTQINAPKREALWFSEP
jgi:hypothetical protein